MLSHTCAVVGGGSGCVYYREPDGFGTELQRSQTKQTVMNPLPEPEDVSSNRLAAEEASGQNQVVIYVCAEWNRLPPLCFRSSAAPRVGIV